MNLVEKLERAGIAKPPRWLAANVHYLTVMGSAAYGCSDDDSDLDVYGFCIPPKEDVFPHLKGEIPGFGRQAKRFEQYQEHHLSDPCGRKGRGQEYDLTVYSIVKFFQLAMDNNPNMVDSLFTDRTDVVHSTPVAEMVRDRRRVFLHKGAWHKFKGYAYSQLSKIEAQGEQVGAIRDFERAYGIPHETTHEDLAAARSERQGHELYCRRRELTALSDAAFATYEQLWRDGLDGDDRRKGSKRFASRKRFGYDVKFATHLVRLVQEVEQVLVHGDIDLRRDADLLKDVRAGNWTPRQVREWFGRRELEIEPLYHSSTAVPYSPDEAAIKALLLDCLEHHYGRLADCVVDVDRAAQALRDIKAVIEKAGV